VAEEGVQLELARVELAVIASALRQRLATAAPAPGGLIPTDAEDASLLTLDDWWAISSQLGSPTVSATFDSLVREAVTRRLGDDGPDGARQRVAVLDERQRAELAALVAELRGAPPADALDRALRATDAASRCRQLRSIVRDMTGPAATPARPLDEAITTVREQWAPLREVRISGVGPEVAQLGPCAQRDLLRIVQDGVAGAARTSSSSIVRERVVDPCHPGVEAEVSVTCRGGASPIEVDVQVVPTA